MKLREISELAKCMAVMNSDGLELLVNYAKDITGHKELCKRDGDLTPKQFDEQVERVLQLVERNYIKECAA